MSGRGEKYSCRSCPTFPRASAAHSLPSTPSWRWKVSFVRQGRQASAALSLVRKLQRRQCFPSCGLLIYSAEATCVCVHRPVVAANYAAASSWAAGVASPDALFPASAAATALPICVWLVLRTHLPHHLLLTFTCSRRLGTLPTCKRLWTQSGSPSMTGVIIFMSTLSVHSDKTFALAMSSTVQPWRGKNSMFTQGFVPVTSPWVGTSSAQSSAERTGTAVTTLFLTKSAIFVDRFVPIQQCLPLSFASGVHLSKLDGPINLGGVFPYNTRLLSSVFLLLLGHAPLYSRCTGVCICTCAPRQTPHGHIHA